MGNKLKLHLGCGSNKISDWTNLDRPSIDVIKPLEYPSASVDYIFHEHLLEHLDEVDGFNFLKECFRVLKPEGVLRISCPSLDGFIHCYRNWDELDQAFKDRFGSKTTFFNTAILGEAAFFKGKMFDNNGNIKYISNDRNWHKFYYDKEDIKNKLLRIGFKGVYFVDKHQSPYPELRNLERRFKGKFEKFPQELDLTLEAIK